MLIDGCKFRRNIARGSSGARGGALQTAYNNEVVVVNCIFEENVMENNVESASACTQSLGCGAGGAFRSYGDTSVVVTNSIFRGNVASGIDSEVRPSAPPPTLPSLPSCVLHIAHRVAPSVLFRPAASLSAAASSSAISLHLPGTSSS